MATHSTVWSAILSNAGTALAAGYGVVKNGNTYLASTTANRATYGRTVGISLTAASTANGSFELQVAGTMSTALTGLGAGTASWVRVSSTGSLERCTPASGDDLVGRCNTAGDLTIVLGTFDSDIIAGGGGALGRLDKAMADANQTLDDEEISKGTWRTTGTLTAKRKVIVTAPATDADNYQRNIHNDCDDFPVAISVGSGDEAIIDAKKSAVVEITPTGTRLVSLSSPKHVIDAEEYGVVDDGVLAGAICSGTDNTAALQAAFDAAVSPSGFNEEQPAREIRFPNRGIVKIDGRLEINYKTHLHLRGPAQIHFTADGTEALLSILSSAHIRITDISFSYENAAFAGSIIQTGWGSPVTDCAYIHIEKCRSFCTDTSHANYNAWSFVRFANCINSSVKDCDISMVGRGVSGRNNQSTPGDPDYAGFANQIVITGNAFHRCKVAGVHNPGEAWHIAGNTFEPVTPTDGIFYSKNGVWQEDMTYTSFAPNITGNWFGDGGVDAGKAWITLHANGANISGNLISGSAGGYSIAIHGGVGYSVLGNDLVCGMNFSDVTDLTDPGDGLSTQSPTGCFVAGNNVSDATPYNNWGICGAFTLFGNSDNTGWSSQWNTPFHLSDSNTTFTRMSAKTATWNPGTVANGAVATSGDLAIYGLTVGDTLAVGAKDSLDAPVPDGILIFAKMQSSALGRVTVLNMTGSGWTPGVLTLQFFGTKV